MTMVLADTSVWIAHFRKANPSLQSLLINDQILCHPLVLVELSCGSPPSPRVKTLDQLKCLRQATVATPDEVMAFVEKHQFYESGCGAIDVSLLASTLLSKHALIWTFDKKLEALARQLDIAYEESIH
ncbi:type II toxin-antitoxin system VapC family toxin [Polynucleobacter antarcticus]|uniref:VapC toxin family PIN domain ribonuclease n=1 Tax=Polynucleobacter antarcticus TaxID=1743162 RepID=A0A6M9PIU0_9BURK|nr:type II toxin-antitoxin system VapC family toxin [Polynucleobacter antarcticus]QKM62064.1 VapC toxin family PIN domain ribonuclease [Polynucleobacter antarcticus]